MAIKKNADGRTATITRTGVTGGAGDGRGTPRRSAPMAQGHKTSAKRLPGTLKPVPPKQR